MAQEQFSSSQQLLTFHVADQLFGVPVLQVNDVLGPQKITHTPLSPKAVSGVMNLRGRIVTAIDVRTCLAQARRTDGQNTMSVVVDYEGELFSLIIDSVGDVLSLNGETYEETPVTLESVWRNISSGIHKLDGKILVILDVKQLLKVAGGRH